MAAGRSVVVVEPKGDLIADVLARIPAERINDVVLIDPTDREAVVGVNPLMASDASSELVADQLLSVFHHTYASSWGPRTSDILYASLLTLARTPGMSLAALPLLLSDASFRRRIVGGLNEPVVLQPFWQAFEAWSAAERTAAVAPTLNKIRPLLVRPSLRAVLGQASPRFEIRQVFTGRKILLVNLAKGSMGPEAAALLGGILMSQLWQTSLERSAVEPAKRHPVFVFVDEFQDYLNLPTDLAEALAQARGLGVGLTLAHQHLGQLNPQMRSAVLANARSRVVFQLAADDARVFTADSQLDPEDFRSLGAFEAYAQLVADDAVQPWLSLRTQPASQPISDAAQVRELSRQQHGVSLGQVDSELVALRSSGREGDLGPKRRPGGER
jgi:type IV secretory pathway TraG/TraD family ATPase VirD4